MSRIVSNPIAALLAAISAILIVYGRVNRRSRWGNRIAVAGYALLVVAGILFLLSRA